MGGQASSPEPNPLALLVQRLNGLRARAGSPSYAELATRSQQFPADQRFSKTLVGSCLTGDTRPSIDFVLGFVRACRDIAHERKHPIAEGDGDFNKWRRDWLRTQPGQRDPAEWFALVRDQLERRGYQAAQEVINDWYAAATLDDASAAWVRQFLRLTAEGRLRPRQRHRLARPAPPEGPFPCREKPLAEMRGFLDHAIGGRGALALVSGPAGMGKSRLLLELLASVPTGIRVEWIRLEHGEAGYRGWRRLLRPLWEEIRHSRLAPPALLPWAQTLDELLLERRNAASLRQESQPPEHVADAVSALIVDIAAHQQPLVLVVDDAHRGGSESDDLLLALADRLSSAPAGILASVRDDALEDGRPLRTPLAATGGHVGSGGTISVVKLPPLDAVGIDIVLARRIGARLPREALDRILMLTEGRPQLVENVQLPPRLPGGRISPDFGRLDETGLAILQASLHQRSAEVLRVLKAAAVLTVGGEVAPHRVAEVAQLDIQQVVQILDNEAAATTVLQKVAHDARFRHDNWIEAVLALCTPQERRVLHARALSVLRTEIGSDPRQLAEHAVAAGVPLVDASDLVKLACQAARLAATDYALAKAHRLYSVGLTYAGGSERVQLLISHADILRYEGEWTQAEVALQQALSAARSLKDPQLEAAALLPMRRLRWTFSLDHSQEIEQIGRVIEALPPGTDLRPQMEAAQSAQLLFAQQQSKDERWALARAALDKLPAVADDLARSEILIGVHEGLQDYIDVKDLLPHAEQAFNHALRAQSLHHQAESILQQTIDLFRLGRAEQAEQKMRQYNGLAQRTASPVICFQQAGLSAMHALARGKFTEAETFTRRADELSAGWGGWFASEVVMAQTGWRLIEEGQIEGLAELIDATLRDITPGNAILWRLAQGIIRAEQQMPEPAAEIVNEVIEETDTFNRLQRGPARIGILALGALLISHPAMENSWPPKALCRWGDQLSSLLEAHSDQAVVIGWPALFFGDKRRFIGLARLRAGDPQTAEALLMQAAETNRRYAALHLRTLYDLARTRTCLPGRTVEARKQLWEITKQAEQLGMRSLWGTSR
ncbi:AAA family ATPase [Streptomyces sp. 4N124]|uniref:AAA family ATPase n=1 Tax=Streptomyces sp. 4N124 TaxID=3457420 RepID=UPI003FD29D05